MSDKTIEIEVYCDGWTVFVNQDGKDTLYYTWDHEEDPGKVLEYLLKGLGYTVTLRGVY
jgi:hypothetical protein